MSPNSRASLIRSATSRRRVVVQVLELLLELLEPFRGEDDVAWSIGCVSCGLEEPDRKTPDRGALPTGARQRGQYSEPARRLRPAPRARLAARARAARASIDRRRVRWNASADRRARTPQPLEVPGVELAQVARRARSAPRCSSARSITQSELGDDLVGGRRARSRAPESARSKSHGLPSAPRASITAAAPVSLVGGARPARRRARPPETITGTRQPLDELARRARSRACPCAGPGARAGGRRSPRRRPPRRGARASVEAGAVRRRASPERSFTVTGRPLPSRAARATATAVRGRASSAAPAPVLQTFGTGQPMLMSIRSAPALGGDRGRRAHHLGVVAEQLDRDGPGARRGGSAAARAACARCGSGWRSSRPSRETARPAPWRRACRRTNQLPIPASGASSTRLAIADRRRSRTAR